MEHTGTGNSLLLILGPYSKSTTFSDDVTRSAWSSARGHCRRSQKQVRQSAICQQKTRERYKHDAWECGSISIRIPIRIPIRNAR